MRVVGRKLSAHQSALYFLLGRCVSAEPAADFAALLDFGSRSTFAAAEAAFSLVTSLLAIQSTSFPVSRGSPSRPHFRDGFNKLSRMHLSA